MFANMTYTINFKPLIRLAITLIASLLIYQVLTSVKSVSIVYTAPYNPGDTVIPAYPIIP